jgi:uncharacterized OB-fold protein
MPKPAADEDTKPFWDGCAEERLLIPRCAICHTPRWPPGPMCPACQSEQTDWLQASGYGRIYSWTVVTHPVDPVLADQVPYIIALVELPEGIRIIANIVDCAPACMTAEMEVALIFQHQDGVRIPNFRPLGQI